MAVGHQAECGIGDRWGEAERLAQGFAEKPEVEGVHDGVLPGKREGLAFAAGAGGDLLPFWIVVDFVVAVTPRIGSARKSEAVLGGWLEEGLEVPEVGAEQGAPDRERGVAGGEGVEGAPESDWAERGDGAG